MMQSSVRAPRAEIRWFSSFFKNRVAAIMKRATQPLPKPDRSQWKMAPGRTSAKNPLVRSVALICDQSLERMKCPPLPGGLTGAIGRTPRRKDQSKMKRTFYAVLTATFLLTFASLNPPLAFSQSGSGDEMETCEHTSCSSPDMCEYTDNMSCGPEGPVSGSSCLATLCPPE